LKTWPLTPIPPAADIPKAVPLPSFQYEAPEYIAPLWEPVIIYREDVPVQPTPKTKSTSETEAAAKKRSKPKQEPRSNQIPEPAASESLPPPTSEFKEVETVDIPFINVEVPVPKPEIIVTAATTATIASVASVGGTLAATAIFQRLTQIAKPVITFALKKLAKARGKEQPLSWARKRAAQRRSRSRKKVYQV